MANIIITASKGVLRVDFGIYVNRLKVSKSTLTSASEVSLIPNGVLVVFSEKMGMIKSLLLSFDGKGRSLKVDSINGSSPNNNEIIYTAIDTLINT